MENVASHLAAVSIDHFAWHVASRSHSKALCSSESHWRSIESCWNLVPMQRWHSWPRSILNGRQTLQNEVIHLAWRYYLPIDWVGLENLPHQGKYLWQSNWTKPNVCPRPNLVFFFWYSTCARLRFCVQYFILSRTRVKYMFICKISTKASTDLVAKI